MNSIYLNDILKLDNLNNIKIRLMKELNNSEWDPIKLFRDQNTDELLKGIYWNYSYKSFKEGQIVIGFVRIKSRENKWLLVHIGRVTKDLNILNNGPAYEYETLNEYEKYCGRLIIDYKNTSQNLIRNSETIINDLAIHQILPDVFENDIFPGYDKVNISWEELSSVIKKDTWRTALQNQKGIYLITDASNGKVYVGSAYGENMILGRWESYINSGDGGNKGLKEVVEFKGLDYIKKNFRYSILEIYKSTTPDEIILERESWWKKVLLSKKFGYNQN